MVNDAMVDQPAAEETQQSGSAASRQMYFAARGFWLPCDQTNFFGHGKDRRFKNPVKFADDKKLKGEALTNNQLEDHVLHRLALVLSQDRYGYTHMVPAYHASNPFGEDPDAAVFVHRTFNAPKLTFEDENDKTITAELDINVTADGIALLVNSSGFYLWVMRYHHKAAISRENARKAVEAYLKQYVYWIVGGNFASRYSGWRDESDLATEYERENSLQEYERDFKGILTFTQINIIFEGLYSSALDFHVFFYDTASDQRDRVKRRRRLYSVGHFIKSISTPLREKEYKTRTPPTDPATQASPQAENDGTAGVVGVVDENVLAFLIDLDLLQPSPTSHQQSAQTQNGIDVQKKAAHNLCLDYLGEQGCGVLLLKFLQATAQITLLRAKRRIERSRRALVAEILQVTQRQDPLLQVEVPPSADKGLKEGAASNPQSEEGEASKAPPPYPDTLQQATGSQPDATKPDDEELDDEDFEEERVPDVNESQLRGYVLLVSAKLPLISNVGVYLDEIAITSNWYSREKVLSNEEHAVSASLGIWQTLLTSIQEELKGLEHAIAQERQDRMVSEEEKIRIEQETLAEIERLQDRNSKSLSPRATFTLAFVSNVFAIASVLVAVFGTGIGQGIANFHLDPGDLSKLLVIILLLALGLSALYFLAQYLFFWIGSLVLTVLRIPFGNRYYYEMDIHVDAPLNPDALGELISGQFKRSGRGEWLIESIENITDAAWKPYRNQKVITGVRFWTKHLWPAFRRPERNSYRVERSGKNEGMHKVYLEVTALLTRSHWYQVFHPSVQAVLVYEVFFHRPGGEERYILNDVRVVSTQGRILGAPQLAQLKDIVANHFVNPLIAQQSRGTWEIVTFSQITQEGQEKRADALMTMTESQGTDSSWKDKALRYLRGAFTALMQLGMASAFLFLLRGLLDVVAVAAGGGLDALNSVQAISQAVYFSQTWTFLMSVSWGWLLGMLILPTLLALGLGAIPFARSWVRKLVIQALNPQSESRPGNIGQQNGAPGTSAHEEDAPTNGASATNGQGQPEIRRVQLESHAPVDRLRFARLVRTLWLVGGWLGYGLHEVFQKGRLVILGGLATLSIVALLSMVIDLLSSHGVHLLFLLR